MLACAPGEALKSLRFNNNEKIDSLRIPDMKAMSLQSWKTADRSRTPIRNNILNGTRTELIIEDSRIVLRYLESVLNTRGAWCVVVLNWYYK